MSSSPPETQLTKIETHQFPMKCPHCLAVSAFPFRASTRLDINDEIELLMRCRECSHEWSIQQRQVNALKVPARRYAVR
jgi:hypothetical protein